MSSAEQAEQYHHLEPEQAYHAAKLGMWIFLATEVHLFGGLFCTFAVFRWRYMDEFVRYGRTLDFRLGTLNTIVLLLSSYFMVMAVDAAQKGLNRKVARRLDYTLLCGCIFLGIKAIEYRGKFAHGIYPSSHIFYGLYFTLTGIHALHVIIGLGLILWLRILASRGRFSVFYYTPVESVGLYWHLVDVIWIYLFPLLYLIGGIGR